MTETPKSSLLEEYNKPKENILSTKKTPEDMRKMIEENGIDIEDIIAFKKMREKAKEGLNKLKLEISINSNKKNPEKSHEPHRPEGPSNPQSMPEGPGTPNNIIDSAPSGNVSTIESGPYVSGINGAVPTQNSGIPINNSPNW